MTELVLHITSERASTSKTPPGSGVTRLPTIIYWRWSRPMKKPVC